MNQWGPNGPQGPMRIVVGNVVIDTQPPAVYPPQPMPPPMHPQMHPGMYPMMQPMMPPSPYAPMMAMPQPAPVPYVPAGVYAATPTGFSPNAMTQGAAWPPALPPSSSSSNALATTPSSQESALVTESPPANPAAQGAFLLGLSVAVTTVAALTVVGLGVFAPGLLLVTGGIVAASTTAGVRLLAQGRKNNVGKVGLDPALQHRLLQIAMASHGKLTVTGTAHALQIPMEDAERALHAMSKSGYVDVEVDPDSGVVQYVFREISPQGAPSGPGVG